MDRGADIIIFKIIIYSVILLFIGSCLYLYFKIREHKKHYEIQRNLVEKHVKDDGLCMSFCWVLQRNYVHYYSYAVQMVLNLLCNVSSILFSIGTFSSAAISDGNTPYTLIMAFLSVSVLVISLFLKPSKRAQQYINVWRKTNEDIFAVIQTLGVSNTDENLKKLIEKAVLNRCNIEFTLSSDED